MTRSHSRTTGLGAWLAAVAFASAGLVDATVATADVSVSVDVAPRGSRSPIPRRSRRRRSPPIPSTKSDSMCRAPATSGSVAPAWVGRGLGLGLVSGPVADGARGPRIRRAVLRARRAERRLRPRILGSPRCPASILRRRAHPVRRGGPSRQTIDAVSPRASSAGSEPRQARGPRDSTSTGAVKRGPSRTPRPLRTARLLTRRSGRAIARSRGGARPARRAREAPMSHNAPPHEAPVAHNAPPHEAQALTSAPAPRRRTGAAPPGPFEEKVSRRERAHTRLPPPRSIEKKLILRVDPGVPRASHG